MTTEALPTLQPTQWFFRGLVFGEGTDFMIDGEVTGLDELITRSADKAIPRGPGDISYPNYPTSRNVVLPFALHSREGQIANIIDTFNRTFVSQDELPPQSPAINWLVFQGRTPRAYRAKVVRRFVQTAPEAYVSGMHRATVQLVLSDPRGYGLEAKSVIVPLFATSGGGIDLPADLPFDMTGGSSGSGSAHNAGNARAWPVIRWQNTGSTAVTQVELTNETAEQTITIATAIQPGQTLVADMDALVRRIPGPHISIDGATRYNDWIQPREPFPLYAGANLLSAAVIGEQSVTTRLDYRATYL